MGTQRRPKIVQLLVGSQDGGADTFFVKLCVALHEEGLAQKIVISPHSQRECIFREHSCDISVLNFGGIGELRARPKFKHILATYKPDVVVAWMNRAARRVPPGPYKRIARLGGYYPVRWYRAFDYLVANTPDIARHIAESGFPIDRTTVIGNFGDFESGYNRTKAELGIPDGQSLLLCLGRLHREKGFDVAIKALQHVPSAVLVIAGSGEEGLSLRALARRCGLAERVLFMDWRYDAASFLAAADACIVPSRHEPLGNVILEAWRAGTPVIASKSEGPSWLIKTDENGLLVPIDDPIALAAAIRKALSNSKLRSVLVRGGRSHHDMHFSKKRITRAYIDFLTLIA